MVSCARVSDLDLLRRSSTVLDGYDKRELGSYMLKPGLALATDDALRSVTYLK